MSDKVYLYFFWFSVVIIFFSIPWSLGIANLTTIILFDKIILIILINIAIIISVIFIVE